MFGLTQNPFDRLLKDGQKRRIKRLIVFWNRGLGDIPLGLYALIMRAQCLLPEAQVLFITREDLIPVFELLKGCTVVVSKLLIRGQPFDVDTHLNLLGLQREATDLVVDNLNPTKVFKWQLGKVTPRLYWHETWDEESRKFSLPQGCIGAHLDSETGQYYRYNKNWPRESWLSLFQGIERPILLFGNRSDEESWPKNVIDLRGKTTLIELISIIKNDCTALVAPDSGILSTIYYIDANFPLKIVSLWADPNQGILRQRVKSPNSELVHVPLIGSRKDVSKISTIDVLRALEQPLPLGTNL